jgi:hypothetical protein
MKTFIWKGGKAQAMRGNYNDDLVISLAIGMWLYDSSSDHSRNSAALNKAMLEGMSVKTNTLDIPRDVPTAVSDVRPYNPIRTDSSSDSKNKRWEEKWGQKSMIPPEFEWVYK